MAPHLANRIACRMPYANRVTPFGRFEATPHRGLLIGNRGILHDEEGKFGAARWRHPHWIACALEYKGWRRRLLQPRAWTELFFLDEATALAAGHRPCALCRRVNHERFRAAWQRAFALEQKPSAVAMDRALHAARIERRGQRHHRARLETLPDGAMIEVEGAAWLVLGDRLLRWSHAGYGDERKRGRGEVSVITPSPTIACLASGYSALLHPSAN
jgi:hypothetical protein